GRINPETGSPDHSGNIDPNPGSNDLSDAINNLSETCYKISQASEPENVLPVIQGVLEAVGSLETPISPAADLLDGGLDAAQGNYLSAALNTVAALPLASAMVFGARTADDFRPPTVPVGSFRSPINVVDGTHRAQTIKD